MKYKYFYITVGLRIISITLLSIAGSYAYFVKHQTLLAIVFLILVLLTSINLIKYFNKLNRWISFFLLGIENEDTSLKIPSNSGNKAINEVLNGMRNLNDLFKQTKMEIATKEQYFKTIINQSATGLFSINENGRVININPTASQLTGLREQHHINSLQKIDINLPEFIQKNIEKTMMFENNSGQKLQFKRSEIISKEQKIILIAVSDITKELDTQEVDAWIKLARTLSHEIMNSITPITTLSQVILGYFTKNNQVKTPNNINQETLDNTVKGMHVIEDRGVSLMHFVQNYRKFTKLPQPQINEVNLSKILEISLHAVGAYPYFNRIKVEKKIPQNITFFTDENLISQVFINILKNAYEAVINDENEPIIKIKLEKLNQQIHINISNNGKPIPDSIKEQIFVPFFSAKPEGSGIGLSLSKQILLQMNGDITLKPYKSTMTRFEIILR